MTQATQQDLFSVPAHSCESFVHFLNEGSALPVEVTFTRNRTRMLSVRFKPDRVYLRLHEAFLNAPQDILVSLKNWLKTRRKVFWLPVAAHARKIIVNASPVKKVRTTGEIHDLKQLLNEVCREFFNGKPGCRITWGRAGWRRRRSKTRTVHWGTFDKNCRLIRIHPALDSTRVPREFVKFIIYHELLHACIPSERRNGRNAHHHATFRKMERQFPDWTEMQKLSVKLLRIL